MLIEFLGFVRPSVSIPIHGVKTSLKVGGDKRKEAKEQGLSDASQPAFLPCDIKVTAVGTGNRINSKSNAGDRSIRARPRGVMSQCGWFALQVRSSTESLVATCLTHKGYEVFLPTYRTRRAWSDRIKVVDRPLFPSYVFCRFQPAIRAAPVVTTPGVIRIVGCGSSPARIDDAEIDAVRHIATSRLSSGPWPFLSAGARVRIHSGPLAGIDGIVIDLKSEKRLVVSVSLLQRSISVAIDTAWVLPI